MSTTAIGLAGLSLTAWIYLLTFHGGFWRIREVLGPALDERAHWPAVVAICPARNEASVVAPAIVSLLRQDYPGELRVILVDDDSDDGTADMAARAAAACGRAERLQIVRSGPPPEGWAGKLWALSQGTKAAGVTVSDARYLWFSDADIVASTGTLKRLVAKAEDDDFDLVSLMVEISGRAFWERLLIPPFIFFFRKLYPFAWVNDHGRRTAAAAGGCVLLRRAALERAGGLARIRGALIDDCTLAGIVKADGRAGGGRLWLGQTRASRSIRPYDGLAGIWRMVARSAYTQLRHSPVLLAGALLGMVLVYLVPPLTVAALPIHGSGVAVALGLGAWLAMTVAFWPTLRFYDQPPWLAPLLPLSAAFYSAMTFDSAVAHWRGRGGRWKGRVEQRDSAVEGRAGRG